MQVKRCITKLCALFFLIKKRKLFVAATSLHQAHRHQLNGVAGEGEDNAETVDVRDTETRSDEGIGEGVGQLFMVPSTYSGGVEPDKKRRKKYTTSSSCFFPQHIL